MKLPIWLGAWLLFVLASPAFAAQPSAPLEGPALEAKVQRVASELRCLVCQNQSIADSNAELAQDLRREVRRMLARGDSEEQVRAFMVTRYGDFVLYRPPLNGATVVLWVGPFLLLAGAIWAWRRIGVNRRRQAAEAASGAPLSPAEEARLRALVEREHGLQ